MLGASSLLCLLVLLAATPGPAEPAPSEERADEAAATEEDASGDTRILPESPEGMLLLPGGLPLTGSFTFQTGRSWLIPLVEVPVLNLAILSFNVFVLKVDWAQVSADSVAANLQSPWVIDSDDAWVNFAGHPYHGTLAYNAARSSGLTFWESAAFPLVSSTLWEVAAETEPPSLNDHLLTAISGIFLGEALFRTSRLLLDGPRPPGPLQQLGGFLLNPLGGINRQLFGRRVRRGTLPKLPPYELRLLVGATGFAPGRLATPEGATLFAPRLQPYAGLELTYGFPDAPGTGLRAPFEHFHLKLAAGLPAPLTGDLYLRGLIVGRALGTPAPEVSEGGAPAPNGTAPSMGVWGAFGNHDFGTGPGFRVATTGLGLGSTLQWNLGVQRRGGPRLRATGLLSGVLLGGAGTFAEADVVDTGAYDEPLYSVGPGGPLRQDVELAHPDIGVLGLTGRVYRLTGLTPGRGWERVDLLRALGLLRLAPGHLVGAEVLLGRRHADAQGGTRQRGVLGRLFWVLELEHAPRR